MGVALTIGAEQAGERLDRFLAGAVPGLSRSQAQRLIEEGRGHVACRQAKAHLALKDGAIASTSGAGPMPARSLRHPRARAVPRTPTCSS